MNDKRIRSTTAMSTFLTCRRKYELRNVRRLRPINSPNWSRWGRAFHRFDECYHTGMPFLESVAAARDVFWAEQERSDDLQSDWEELVQIADTYASLYPVLIDTAPTPVVRELTTGLRFLPELVEVPFRIPIFTPGGRKSAHAEYTGIFDGIVEDSRGDLWVYETKTVASVTEAFFERLSFDRQVLRYVYAARQIFGDRVKGVIYNAISKTAARKPSRRQDGTLSTAAVITTPEILHEELRECRLSLAKSSLEPDVLQVANDWDLGAAAAYLAHVMEENTQSAWDRLTERANGEEAITTREKLLKRIAKAQQDNLKYRDILVAAEKRIFFARRFHEVSNIELEEIQWELYQLDRDIHLAEMDGRFFPNDRACDQMGGCEFRALCVRGDSSLYEESKRSSHRLEDAEFLTPTNPRPVRSGLRDIIEGLYDPETKTTF